MLHAPTSENKNETAQPKSDSVIDRVRALPSRLHGSMKAPAMDAMDAQVNGMSSSGSAQDFSALQSSLGNQSVLRLLDRSPSDQRSGRPLDSQTRSLMESRTGQDLGRVRIHTGAAAAKSTQSLKARAYTVGQEIVFGANEYQPNTAGGRRLLAHELVHTLQPQPASKLVSEPGDPSELEAERLATEVMTNVPRATPSPSRTAGAVIQRATEETVNAGIEARRKNRLPFNEQPLGLAQKSTWDSAAILERLKVAPDSAMGKAITAGPDEVASLSTQLSEQATRETAAVSASERLKSALQTASSEATRMNAMFQSTEATYDDLMKMVALSEIMAKTCSEKVAQLFKWSTAAANQDAIGAFEAKDSKKVEWAAAYDQTPYEDAPKAPDEIRATTKGGLWKEGKKPEKVPEGAGIPAAAEITFEVLIEVFPGLAKGIADDPTPTKTREKQVKTYVANLNEAFKLMKIDTVEAQAVYLSHAFIESDQFRQFTETQGSRAVLKGEQKWVDDPEKIKLDLKDLKGRYPEGGTVNPHGEFEFIGRGPVQVTHQRGYKEVVELLEQVAAQYDKEGAGGDMQACESGATAREAADAVKADPKQAANPKYTFLISAAFMKSKRADIAAAGTRPNPSVPWTGTDAPSSWVAGGEQEAGSPQAEALGKKSEAYAKIYPVLLREAKAPKKP